MASVELRIVSNDKFTNSENGVPMIKQAAANSFAVSDGMMQNWTPSPFLAETRATAASESNATQTDLHRDPRAAGRASFMPS